jgi:hypothetical protein
MNEWNIQARAHQCQACHGLFTDKQTYHTLLFDDKQSLTRLDICESCWQNQYRHGTSERKGFLSYWQGVYQLPPSTPEPIQKENAESLLRKIIELNDARYMDAGYILAVMLERKRLLKVKEQLVRDGGRVFVYEHARTGEVFTISDPNLQLNQLEQVQRDVALLLEKGVETGPASLTGHTDSTETDSLPSTPEEPPSSETGGIETVTAARPH